MATTSPSDNSDATNISPPVDILGRAPIKRARPQLSCTPCRQGKLKCNREHPVCDQCAKRARHEACQYVPPPPKNKQAQNMRGRIRNLESLVVNLINQRQEQGTTGENVPNGSASLEQISDSRVDKDATDEPSVDSFGQLRISNAGAETSYVGAGHWSSVLKEIEEVKESLEEEDVIDEVHDEEWDHFNARSTVTFGIPKPVSKAMLIQEMPERAEVDKLLPLWFNSADPLLYCIHAPTFQEEYKQFWRDPSSTSVMWIAMLYSIMALGIIVGPRNPGMNAHASTYALFDTTDHMARAANKYQQMASSAMVLADVAKSQPYTLETLMIYGECEFLRRDDHHAKLWLMHGVTLRVALRMGYHRDPNNFKGISPFLGEMRRRTWHILNMMDVLVSFAVGLPAISRGVESDVRPPRNLYDSDISPGIKELPRERPHSEITPASYTISKSRLCAIFAEAAELSQKVVPPKYSYVMALDKRLEDNLALIPDGMRVRPMEDSITEPHVLIMCRYNVELMYLKARIVLHRNYLTAGQSHAKWEESRKKCVSAALQTLRHQKDIFHACLPGGQLAKVWWYMSSLNTYDFLLAAMVLCLELNHLQTVESSSPRIPELFEVLQTAHDIWANHPVRFRESTRGADMVAAMLKKCSTRPEPPASVHKVTPEAFEQVVPKTDLDLTPESIPDDGPAPIWGPWQASTDVPSLDPPNIPSEIDWTLWDNTMQDQNNIIPQPSTNPAMDSWLAMTSNVNASVQAFHDFQDPLNLANSSFYAPPPGEMDWSLQ